MPDIAKQYKSSLRRQVMMIVLVLVGFYVVNLIVTMVVMVAYLFTSGDLLNMDAEIMMDDAPLGLMSIFGMIGGAAMFFILRGKRMVTSDLTQVNERIVVRDLLMLIVLMFAVQAVTTIGNIIIEPLLNQFGYSMLEDYGESISALYTPTGILYIAIIGPIFEEIMFRGAIQKSLEKYGANFAIVISSILFGAYHLILFQAVFAFMLGLLLAYVAQRFSIKWAMVLHIINNSYSVVVTLVSGISPEAEIITSLVLLAILFVSLVGGIIILVLNRQRIKAQLAAWRPVSMYTALGYAPPVAAPAYAAPGYAAPGYAPAGPPAQAAPAAPQAYGVPGGYQAEQAEPLPAAAPPAAEGWASAPAAPPAAAPPASDGWAPAPAAAPAAAPPAPEGWAPAPAAPPAAAPLPPEAWVPPAPVAPPDMGPKPQPFKLAFSSVFLLAALALVLAYGINQIVT